MADLNEIDNELRILVIDGSLTVLDCLKGSIAQAFPEVYTYRVHHCETERKNSVSRCRKEIAELVNTKAINVIIAEYQGQDADHLHIAPFEITEFFSADVALDDYHMLPEILAGIKKVIVHAYDPELNWEKIREAENKINKILEREVAFFIELSSSFTKYDLESGAQYSNPGLLPKEDELRSFYYQNFSAILQKILKEVADPGGNLHEFSEQFDALEKIKNIDSSNKKMIGYLRQENQEKLLEKASKDSMELYSAIQLFEFRIGHVTFISDIKENRETHLLDIPYKDYYDQVNTDLEKQTWTSIYKDDNNNFLDDQWVYFDYQMVNNEFQLFEFYESGQLKQLNKTKDIKDFLPYLHSSIFYDEQAWSFPVKKTEKIRKQNSVKLFFLFSRLNNRSFSSIDKLHSHLNFSVWKIDSDHYNLDQVKSVTQLIKQTYFYNIKDVVQGTITLTIIDYIRKMEDRNREEITKNLLATQQLGFVKAHKHTIRNFGYEQRLVNLSLALELGLVDKAQEILGVIEKLNLLRDVTIDFIYRTDEPIHKLLLHKILSDRGFLYSEILKLINDGQSLKTQNLFIDKDAEGSAANQLNIPDLITVFNLLVNLYSNTLTHANEDNDFLITFKLVQNQIYISFITNSFLKDVFVEFLMGEAAINPSDGQGLYIIKECLEKLKSYISIEIQRPINQTIITLKISKHENSYH